VAVVDGIVLTEQGEVITNLPLYAWESEPAVWVTNDPAGLLNIMLTMYADHPSFNYQLITSRESDQEVTMSYTKLTKFGFSKGRKNRPGGRHKGMHTVWCPSDMTRNPLEVLGGHAAPDLVKFGVNVRDWCKEQGLPIPSTLAGVASALLRDARFWPDARGRVPRATNERVRKYLPGVYAELRAREGVRYQAISLDQRTAYHRAAQEVATPNPNNLYARGYFNDPEGATELWAVPGDGLYEKITNQPGLVCAQLSASPRRKNRTRPPAIPVSGTGRTRVYLWTNELELCQDNGVIIDGITAAWTSTTADPGLPIYGKFAQAQIEASDEYRKRWLKPTLHATYGLLAARERDLAIGHYRGRGPMATYILGYGHEFSVHEARLPAHSPVTTNVLMLGTLQAEIRARSMKMAHALMDNGAEVLHIHADGIHVRGVLPLVDQSWRTGPLDNLEYMDRVSWFSDQGDVLPGRDERMRVELRRHRSNLLHQKVKAVLAQAGKT
jgi:hypothetical protein